MTQTSIFSFPFAGGNVFSYQGINKFLGDEFKHTALELPGRGKRMKEELISDSDSASSDYLAQIGEGLKEPYILFGHSLGAVLSVLCARKIVQKGLPRPKLLVISGSPALCSFTTELNRYKLSSKEFIQMLCEFGGLPKVILEDQEMMDFFEPILRTDFQILDLFLYEAQTPLDIPILQINGDSDLIATGDTGAWQRESSLPLESLIFEGDHFYLFNHWNKIVELISARLKSSEESNTGFSNEYES